MNFYLATLYDANKGINKVESVLRDDREAALYAFLGFSGDPDDVLSIIELERSFDGISLIVGVWTEEKGWETYKP